MAAMRPKLHKQLAMAADSVDRWESPAGTPTAGSQRSSSQPSSLRGSHVTLAGATPGSQQRRFGAGEAGGAHSFFAVDLAEMRRLEQEHADLSNAFSRGRMHAFAQKTFADLDAIRQQQEELARRHINMEKTLVEAMSAQKDRPSAQTLDFDVFGEKAPMVNDVLQRLDQLCDVMHDFKPEDPETEHPEPRIQTDL